MIAEGVDRDDGVFVGEGWLMAKARKPKKPKRDETREERISMEIVVDALSRTERDGSHDVGCPAVHPPLSGQTQLRADLAEEAATDRALAPRRMPRLVDRI